MKNLVFVILVLFLAVSCKKELVKEPKRLIEKGKMIDIMYDLSVLDAIKYNNPLSLDSVDASPKKFILQKYKVDSLQFAQSNMYYAADYENYKDMFDQIAKRLEKNQKKVDSLLKIEKKKADKANKNKKAAGPAPKLDDMKPVNTDSIKKAKRNLRK